MVSQLCSDYTLIIEVWAQQEGEINNIVAHDEYGNYASDTPHDHYPDNWR